MNDKEINKLFIEWFLWTIECIGDETDNKKFQRIREDFQLPDSIYKGNIFGEKEKIELDELPLPILSGFLMFNFVMYVHSCSPEDLQNEELLGALKDSIKDLYERHLKSPLRKFCGRNGIPQLELGNLQYYIIKVENDKNQI